MLFLNRDDLSQLNITTQQAVDSLEALIKKQGKGVWASPKTVLRPDHRYLMTTLSAANEPSLLAVKSLVLNQENTRLGLPAINALVTLLDSETGLPQAVIDGNWITSIRTACASAVAAKRMANSTSSVLAFIGCGVQARSHLDLYRDLFPLKEIRAFGRGTENRDDLCHIAQNMGLRGIACDDARAAVEGADLVVTSIPMTTNVPPFIDCRWLKSGVFVSSTDMGLPLVPETLDVFDRIIIDDFDQGAAMPNPMAPMTLIQGDINGLVAGTVEGRQSPEQSTMFLFRAVVLGDLALAALAYRIAVERDIGTNIPW